MPLQPVKAPWAEPIKAPGAEPVKAPWAEPIKAPWAEPIKAPGAEPIKAPWAEPIKAPWEGVTLVCRKCSRKLGGGFGRKGKQDLAKVLQEALKATGRRRALRVIPVDCLKLCPKRAVTMVGPAPPGHVLAVPAGADALEVLRALEQA